jgi:hypothetical protein
MRSENKVRRRRDISVQAKLALLGIFIFTFVMLAKGASAYYANSSDPANVSQWLTQARNVQGTSYYPASLATTVPVQLWTSSAMDNIMPYTPIINNGIVYECDNTGKNIYAWDLYTGAVIWSDTNQPDRKSTRLNSSHTT